MHVQYIYKTLYRLNDSAFGDLRKIKLQIILICTKYL